LIRHLPGKCAELKVLDMGGGTGAWVRYLWNRGFRPKQLALADSSLLALRAARPELPAEIMCYQVDIMRPMWQAEWDVIFCLDVLEHLERPDHALENLKQALRPKGILIVTVPALPFLWSWVDECDGHKRRYLQRDLWKLAESSGFHVVDLRYFMFSLVPLVWLSRVLSGRQARRATPSELADMSRRHHRVPAWPINEALNALLTLEVLLNPVVKLPWGTSLLAVLRETSG